MDMVLIGLFIFLYFSLFLAIFLLFNASFLDGIHPESIENDL